MEDKKEPDLVSSDDLAEEAHATGRGVGDDAGAGSGGDTHLPQSESDSARLKGDNDAGQPIEDSLTRLPPG